MAPFWPQHPWFPDLLDLLVAVPMSSHSGGIRQPHFHCFHQNLHVLQMTAFHISFGFSSAVARQFAFCWGASTRVNYQAKWAVYRAWYRRHGHSVSHPSVLKIAPFLLYLWHSLSLSFSSIASNRSMLCGVFRFVFSELSSHFVFRDPLRSFRLERPVSSFRVPPWDLSHVISSLCDPPIEPPSSCPLRELMRKVLFLLALVMAHSVSELHAVSSVVSFSVGDVYLSFLPEFWGPRLILFLALSGFILFLTLLVPFRMNFFFVR